MRELSVDMAPIGDFSSVTSVSENRREKFLNIKVDGDKCKAD